MQRKAKPYYDEQGHLIIRPYRVKDLAAIYDVSTKTIRKWINNKAPDCERKSTMFYSVDQVTAILSAIGMPKKVSLMVPVQQLKQAL